MYHKCFITKYYVLLLFFKLQMSFEYLGLHCHKRDSLTPFCNLSIAQDLLIIRRAHCQFSHYCFWNFANPWAATVAKNWVAFSVGCLRASNFHELFFSSPSLSFSCSSSEPAAAQLPWKTISFELFRRAYLYTPWQRYPFSFFLFLLSSAFLRCLLVLGRVRRQFCEAMLLQNGHYCNALRNDISQVCRVKDARILPAAMFFFIRFISKIQMQTTPAWRIGWVRDFFYLFAAGLSRYTQKYALQF